jgi:hypothetical protein
MSDSLNAAAISAGSGPPTAVVPVVMAVIAVWALARKSKR